MIQSLEFPCQFLFGDPNPRASIATCGRGAQIHWDNFIQNCQRRKFSKLLTFTEPHMKLFSNISPGRENKFIRHTSGGEAALSLFTWPDNQKPRVCILGGGLGGLYTALRLESLIWPKDRRPQVLLVDQSDRFVFKPMLYELLSGEVDAWEIAPTFTELLKNTSIQFITGRVKLLRPSDQLNHLGMEGPGRLFSRGTVHLESGTVIEYDCQVGSSFRS